MKLIGLAVYIAIILIFSFLFSAKRLPTNMKWIVLGFGIVCLLILFAINFNQERPPLRFANAEDAVAHNVANELDAMLKYFDYPVLIHSAGIGEGGFCAPKHRRFVVFVSSLRELNLKQEEIDAICRTIQEYCHNHNNVVFGGRWKGMDSVSKQQALHMKGLSVWVSLSGQTNEVDNALARIGNQQPGE